MTHIMAGIDKVTKHTDGRYYVARKLATTGRPYVEHVEVNTECDPPHVYGFRNYIMSDTLTNEIMMQAALQGTIN